MHPGVIEPQEPGDTAFLAHSFATCSVFGTDTFPSAQLLLQAETAKAFLSFPLFSFLSFPFPPIPFKKARPFSLSSPHLREEQWALKPRATSSAEVTALASSCSKAGRLGACVKAESSSSTELRLAVLVHTPIPGQENSSRSRSRIHFKLAVSVHILVLRQKVAAAPRSGLHHMHKHQSEGAAAGLSQGLKKHAHTQFQDEGAAALEAQHVYMTPPITTLGGRVGSYVKRAI
eukprot:187346-Pelagomonas_calceolata.AAC.3